MSNSKKENFCKPAIDKLRNIPLFSDLEEVELENVLENSKINKFKKGEILFLAQEEVFNLYILLKGSVKIFALDEDGNETSLQLIDNQTFINDVFADTFQTSAQILEDSQIALIPIKHFRKSAQSSLALSNNILRETSLKNTRLLNQLTNLKLSNSIKKVGQFLLETSFGEGNDKNEEVQLKQDKHVIASYLGINPETFSRTLKKLKNDGEINVEKNQIKLAKLQSLCSYCNSEISEKCSHYGSDFCKEK